jgi:hypothetical protein
VERRALPTMTQARSDPHRMRITIFLSSGFLRNHMRCATQAVHFKPLLKPKEHREDRAKCFISLGFSLARVFCFT